MKIIHSKGYNKEDCLRFKDVVHGNVLQSIRVLIHAMENLNIPFENPQNAEISEKIIQIPEQQIVLQASSILTPALGKDIKMLWQDKGMRKVVEQKSKFQLNDSAE